MDFQVSGVIGDMLDQDYWEHLKEEEELIGNVKTGGRSKVMRGSAE